jgi:prophage antirepressor-like protein
MNAQIEQKQHLAVFNFNNEKKLRTEIDELGKIWFCAKDICDILGYVNTVDAINKHCKPKGIAKRYTLTEGGEQELTFIDEGNVNRLMLRSNKPEAERLSDLICEEVIPSIYRTGGYLLPGANQHLSLIEENKKLDLIVKQHEKYLELAEERYEHTLDIFSWLEVKTREFDRILNDIAWKVYEKERNAMKKPTHKK